MTDNDIERILKSRFADLSTIMDKLSLSTKKDEQDLLQLLDKMIYGGKVARRDKSYYLLADQKIMLMEVSVKSRNFVILRSIPDGFECRISGREADFLLLGDLVYVKEFQKGVFHCLEYLKNVDTLKGYYSVAKNGQMRLFVPYLEECGKTVYVEKVSQEVSNGDLCLGKIRNIANSSIYVDIEKVLVKADSVSSDISCIVAMNDAPLDFPDEVMKEADSLPEKVKESDLLDRKDYRDHLVYTIDGEDARDFDDAVEIERVLNGYQVTVHIADVTHYVKEGHPIDDEAVLRGTSLYLADRVVPMLPFKLSDGICSLNPGVDRLVMSVEMQIDSKGNIFKSEIHRGVIRSKARLTYNEVNRLFNKEENNIPKEVQENLFILRECAQKVRKRRRFQGALELETSEIRFRLDENGTPVEVIKETQGESQKIIEDMMIATNCQVAKLLKRNHIPVLYRIHEFPPLAKIETLRNYLKRMDLLRIFPRTQDISGARLNDFLFYIEDDNMRYAVSKMLLRSMAKARYSPEDVGHFGLSEMDYCHFTSPIRRYPDDIVHRLVKDYLLDGKKFDYSEVYSVLEDMGNRTTICELRSDKIEREVDDLEACKYMSSRIGELYHGRVTTIVNRGMFIETEIGIEGFLPFNCMHGDVFHYDERTFTASGKTSGVTFIIGSKVDIKVFNVDVEERKIDFATPEFYDTYALDLSDRERESLALEGIRFYKDSEYTQTTGKSIEFTNKPRFKDRNDRDFKKRDRKDSSDYKRNDFKKKDSSNKKFDEKIEHVSDKSSGFTFTLKEKEKKEKVDFRGKKKETPKKNKPSFEGYAAVKKEKKDSFERRERRSYSSDRPRRGRSSSSSYSGDRRRSSSGRNFSNGRKSSYSSNRTRRPRRDGK